VGDIKEAAKPAGGKMLLHDPGFVIQGHLPPGKFNQMGAVALVPGVERGLFRFGTHIGLQSIPRGKISFSSKLTLKKMDVKKTGPRLKAPDSRLKAQGKR